MQQEIQLTTYQDDYTWPVSMPAKNKKTEMTLPKTAQQKKLPEACKEFAKAFDCSCKKPIHAGGGVSKKNNAVQGNCLHVNVIMPYQVNFNNISAKQMKGKDGLTAYIYGSERKEAIQAAAMKCTDHSNYTMKDINKKINIKLRPKTSPNNKNDCNSQECPQIAGHKEEVCLTMDELKALAKIARLDGFRKTFEQPPSYKGHKPKNFCAGVKPEERKRK